MKTLRDLRKGCGISQVSLAEILSGIRGGGAYQGPISNIERGEVSPTVKRLADILAAMGYELRIEARKGRECHSLDLSSLMGKSPRAKDAPEKRDPGPIPEPSKDPVLVAPEPPLATLPEPETELESLLTTILKI